MDTGLPNHCDAFYVFFMDAEVGTANGDGDASLQGAIMRDDLDGENTTYGGGLGVCRKTGLEMDLHRLVVP